jgi:hypothetical protein
MCKIYKKNLKRKRNYSMILAFRKRALETRSNPPPMRLNLEATVIENSTTDMATWARSMSGAMLRLSKILRCGALAWKKIRWNSKLRGAKWPPWKNKAAVQPFR